MPSLRAIPFVYILAASCNVEFAWARYRGANEASCPVLHRCSCKVVKLGAVGSCKHVSDSREIGADMAAMKGVYFKKLRLYNLSITDLPAEWFSNHTIFSLKIYRCPLRDIGEAALGSINNLRTIYLERTMLNTLPSSLNAVKGLSSIYAKGNTFKVLQGFLSLPQLYKLELPNNSIEEVDDEYFMSLPKLNFLELSQNKIQHLSPVLFAKSRNLREVRLQKNRITVITGEFDNLPYLEKIDMSQNMLMDITDLAKSRMPLLEEINLAHNRICIVPEFASSNANIKALRLGHNQIINITHGAFRALQGLLRMDLSENKLTDINESHFGAQSNLEILKIKRNKLRNVTGALKNTRRIKELTLTSNFITTITDSFSGAKTLRELSLRDNLISHVADDTFKDNVNLRELNLNENRIQWVGRNAFRGLVTLTTLHLQANYLLSLNGSVSQLPNLNFLDASFNKIKQLRNGEFRGNALLEFITLSENSITSIGGAFTGTVRLKTLRLGGNGVKVLHRSDFPQQMAYRPNVTIAGNPLLCDCRLAWLIQNGSEVRVTRNMKCTSPPWLKGSSLLNLTKEDLFTWRDDCEPGCSCTCTDQGRASREVVVNCSSAALKRIPKLFPEGTTELDLRGNHLEEVAESLKKSAPHVRVISLRNNWISNLTVTAFPDKVRSLDLRDNRLKKLPIALVLGRNLTSLWLSNNPFQCDCDDYSFRQWLEANHDVVRDARHITCTEGLNALVSQRAFVTLREHQLCPVSFPAYATYLLCAFGVAVVTLALSAAYIAGKRHFIHCLRVRGVCGWTPCIAAEDLDTDKLFDVFVSFSSKDASWVHDQLLPRLEAAGIAYCTYERNFKGGFLLQDIIRDAVASSRRTLLLLTKNFVASEWCRLEFRLAHQRALADNINRLIVVLVDDTAPSSLDKELRLYVRTANYLRWGEPNFWNRFYGSLAKKDAKGKLITHTPSITGLAEVSCNEQKQTQV